MNLRAIAMGAMLGSVAGASLILGLWAVSGSSSPPRTSMSLADRAGVALQASYNTQQIVLGVPLRFVGEVRCKQNRRISATAGVMYCTGTVLGPRNIATRCAQVVGTYYDKLAAFVSSAQVASPCPDGAS